ncbi:MAG: MarR family transcriptional regulator, partial [Verrucomicrobia bacterium]|nr:MarR family transcriptional regulator [Verrucomicrobiota bacterium]
MAATRLRYAGPVCSARKKETLLLPRTVNIKVAVVKSNRTKGPAKRRKGGPGRRPIVSITERQRRTLREIRDYIARKGYPPTIQELAEILGITHASAHAQVSQLVRKGYLRREPRKAQGLAVVREPED